VERVERSMGVMRLRVRTSRRLTAPERYDFLSAVKRG
jgi:hypothetical protein